jgi:AraC-like DNA-binding protein
MKPIPLFRAAHLAPYVEMFQAIGVPVERRLAQACLPTALADDPDQYLPTVPALNFVASAIRAEGIDDLGLRVTNKLRLTDLSQDCVAAARSAATLRCALEAFCRLAPLDDNSLSVWLAPRGDMISICSLSVHPSDCDATALVCSEWVNQMAVVAIVRAFVGPNWTPCEMGFRYAVPRDGFARSVFPATRFLTGRKAAWITVPRSALALPPLRTEPVRPANGISVALGESRADAPHDFVGSLKTMLKSYFCDGYPDIGLAARVSETSVRSLQRKLTDAGTTYSNLVEAARFEVAADMLADPDQKIIDIALAVGFDDPSHFARAFRRVSGLSPREFRRC